MSRPQNVQTDAGKKSKIYLHQNRCMNLTFSGSGFKLIGKLHNVHISYVHCKQQIYDCKFCCYYIYYVSKRCLVPAQSIVHTISGEYFLFFLLNHEDGLVNRKTPCLFVKCRCPYKHVNICKINVFHMYVYISFFLFPFIFFFWSSVQ